MIFKAQAYGTATVVVKIHFDKTFTISRQQLKKAYELNDLELNEKIESESPDVILDGYYTRTYYDTDGPREELEELVTQAVSVQMEDYPPADFRVRGHHKRFEIVEEIEFEDEDIIFRKETVDDPADEEQTY